MTLEEAIKDLEDSLAILWQFYPQHRKDAIRLSIQALKLIEDCRRVHCPIQDLLLPGETKE